MVIMEPCGRLRVLLTQLFEDIVTWQIPSNKVKFKHLKETISWFEKRAQELAEKCRTSDRCEDKSLCDRKEIKNFFEKAYADLVNKRRRYKEKKGA
jgi:hypothetical protein